MSWYYVEKEFYDFAADIEGVNIHYVWTPLGGTPDWENERITRYMPHVQSAAQLMDDEDGQVQAGNSTDPPQLEQLRKKILKLPLQIIDPQTNKPTNAYLLHHYFEIFQDGHRNYSPLYTEEIVTGAASAQPPASSVEGQDEVQQAVQTAQAAQTRQTRQTRKDKP